MKDNSQKISSWTNKNFLFLIIVTYILGALFPRAGILISHTNFGIIGNGMSGLKLSVPFLMAALLLFSSSLDVKQTDLQNLKKHPTDLFWGLILSFCTPLIFVSIASLAIGLSHNPDQLRQALIGLAVIGVMPIVSSSASWTQKSGANLALSVGIILFAAILSPLLTPLAFHLIKNLATPDYADAISFLVDGSISLFLIFGVVLPLLLGAIIRFLFKAEKAVQLGENLKDVNLLIILLLSYFNASHALPQFINDPNWSLLCMNIVAAILLCIVLFGVGHIAATRLKTEDSNKIALTFAVGMGNNGVALIFTSVILVHYPLMITPIIIYSLLQNIIAAIMDKIKDCGR